MVVIDNFPTKWLSWMSSFKETLWLDMKHIFLYCFSLEQPNPVYPVNLKFKLAPMVICLPQISLNGIIFLLILLAWTWLFKWKWRDKFVFIYHSPPSYFKRSWCLFLKSSGVGVGFVVIIFNISFLFSW